MKLRLGTECYEGPFHADEDGDIIGYQNGKSCMTHVRAIEGADIIADAMNLWAETSPNDRIDLDLKCFWCGERIDVVTVRLHADDNERLEDALKDIEKQNVGRRNPTDIEYLDSLETPFCSRECWAASDADSAAYGGHSLSEEL
jgi:hypothetical protein